MIRRRAASARSFGVQLPIAVLCSLLLAACGGGDDASGDREQGADDRAVAAPLTTLERETSATSKTWTALQACMRDGEDPAACVVDEIPQLTTQFDQLAGSLEAVQADAPDDACRDAARAAGDAVAGLESLRTKLRRAAVAAAASDASEDRVAMYDAVTEIANAWVSVTSAIKEVEPACAA